MGLKYAICSEVYQGWKLPEICAKSRELGYTGLEIAHFHLFESVADVTDAGRRDMRATIEAEGLEFVGLHWLLASPKGMHITTSDAATRARGWDYLRQLTDFCSDLRGGPGGVMILGSPHQRATGPDWNLQDAKNRIAEGLAALAPHAAERGVTILMEAVPSDQGDVITTLDQAAEIVRRVNHPAIQTMFDTHNTADETDPPAVLLDRYYDLVRHVHVNEMDGRHPGTGDFDFASILKILLERGYERWVSLEVFDFTAGAENIARENIEYLKKIERGLTASN